MLWNMMICVFVFCGECLCILPFFCMKRWKKGFKRQPQSGTITGENYSSLKIDGNDKRYTWLIPQHEVTASGGLIIQNER